MTMQIASARSRTCRSQAACYGRLSDVELWKVGHRFGHRELSDLLPPQPARFVLVGEEFVTAEHASGSQVDRVSASKAAHAVDLGLADEGFARF